MLNVKAQKQYNKIARHFHSVIVDDIANKHKGTNKMIGGKGGERGGDRANRKTYRVHNTHAYSIYKHRENMII